MKIFKHLWLILIIQCWLLLIIKLKFPFTLADSILLSFIKFLNENGIVYYDWNVASGDATSQAFTADELVDNVMSDVVKYKTSVVLLHDQSNKTTTVEALPRLIEALNEAGAMILPITDDTTIIQHVSVVQ